MESMDKWWAESPWGARPELPERTEEYVPMDLQFQRAAHDANLGKQTSDLMRLSPVFYQRFGDTDVSLRSHLGGLLDGMWEYLTDDSPYRPPSGMLDVWEYMQGGPACVSI